VGPLNVTAGGSFVANQRVVATNAITTRLDPTIATRRPRVRWRRNVSASAATSFAS
jgi:hypothetical protein